jgi:lipopolysaccharide transport system permease protein
MANAAIDSRPPPELRVFGPTKHRVRLFDVWTTRRVSWMLGVRDVKVKYKQAALGPLWLLIAPLGMLAAVTIAFSGVTSVDTGGVPYLVFALTGLTVWTFIQLSLTLGTGAIIANATLVRRSPMPRIAFVIGSMLGNTPPFAMMLAFTLIGTLAFHHLPIQALLLPFLILWLVVFTFSTSLLLASLSVRFRDTISAMPLIIQAGIFVSPVGYSLAGAPKNIHTLLILNPVTGLIEAWRWCLLDMPNPEVSAIVVAGIWTAVLLLVGWRVFGRMEVDFADYV